MASLFAVAALAACKARHDDGRAPSAQSSDPMSPRTGDTTAMAPKTTDTAPTPSAGTQPTTGTEMAPPAGDTTKTADTGTPADNTAQNARPGQTADNAGNGAGDRDVTQQIRQAVAGDSTLSTNAHNVKIVVKDDSVTLRGPVASDAEKKKVEQIAMNAAAGKKVNNELEVAN